MLTPSQFQEALTDVETRAYAVAAAQARPHAYAEGEYAKRVARLDEARRVLTDAYAAALAKAQGAKP